MFPPDRADPYVDDVHIFAPADESEAQRIEIPRGPNIKRPPEHKPLPDELQEKVATIQPDNISTGSSPRTEWR